MSKRDNKANLEKFCFFVANLNLDILDYFDWEKFYEEKRKLEVRDVQA